VPEDLTLLALFKPPQAGLAYARWQEENVSLLAGIPDEAIRVDVGRALNGDFYRVWVRPEFARNAPGMKTVAAEHLLQLMGEIGERAYYAGWMRGLEFDLWDAVVNGPRRYGAIDLDQPTIDDLARFAGAADGWWLWDEKEGEPRLVELAAWEVIYSSR
jgi:hypothetical protein